MDKVALVNLDVERGWQIVSALDQADFGIRVALWAFTSEYEDWRLVLSSPRFEGGTIKDHRRVNDALDAAGVPVRSVPPMLLLASSDPFIKSLRRIFGKAHSVEAMRLGGQMIGDRWIEDAYVYRIS